MSGVEQFLAYYHHRMQVPVDGLSKQDLLMEIEFRRISTLFLIEQLKTAIRLLHSFQPVSPGVFQSPFQREAQTVSLGAIQDFQRTARVAQWSLPSPSPAFRPETALPAAPH